MILPSGPAACLIVMPSSFEAKIQTSKAATSLLFLSPSFLFHLFAGDVSALLILDFGHFFHFFFKVYSYFAATTVV